MSGDCLSFAKLVQGIRIKKSIHASVLLACDEALKADGTGYCGVSNNFVSSHLTIDSLQLR